MRVIERLTRQCYGEPVDYVPVSQLCYALILKSFAQCSELEFYLNPRLQIDAKVAFQKRFPEIYNEQMGIFPEIGEFAGLIATAFGGDMAWMPDAPPWVRVYPIKTVEDIDRLLANDVPDVKKAGLGADYLKLIKYFWDWFPKDIREEYEYLDRNIYCGLLVEGAMLSMGYDKFFVWMYSYPKELHKWLDLATRYFLEYCEAIEEILGDAKYIFIPDHSPAFVNEAQFEEFILPYLNRVFDKYQKCVKAGGWRFWHNEGSVKHIYKAVDKIHAEVWQVGAFDDMGDVKKYTHFCARGNLHPPGILQRGKPEEVVEATRQIIYKAGEGGKLWLGGGGGIAPGTPLENLEAMLIAAKKYGKYPLDRSLLDKPVITKKEWLMGETSQYGVM